MCCSLATLVAVQSEPNTNHLAIFYHESMQKPLDANAVKTDYQALRI